jgi:hypothetical protein
MTVLVDLAIKEFLERYEVETDQNQDLNGFGSYDVEDREVSLKKN